MVNFLLRIGQMLVLLLLVACSSTSHVSVPPDFHPTAERGLLFVVPFSSTFVPPIVADELFDTLVDDLNARRDQVGIQWFIIVKQDLRDVDQAWLDRQLTIRGDIWSYEEDKGCCSTQLRAAARAQIFLPGSPAPPADVTVSAERFFEHDYKTIDDERNQLARQLARQLADRLIPLLKK